VGVIDALRRAGRPARVQQLGHLFGPARCHLVSRFALLEQVGVGVGLPIERPGGVAIIARDDADRLAVGQHVLDLPVGKARVERNHHRSALHRAEIATDERHAVRHAECDVIARLNAVSGQRAGDPIRAFDQLSEGERAGGVADRGGLRRVPRREVGAGSEVHGRHYGM
jgi:hypothetical protein